MAMTAAPVAQVDEVAAARPQSLADLFWSFSLLALQGFGGVLAVVQRELVEKKRWLTLDEFIDDWAVAQIMPGPNVINLSLMIGKNTMGRPACVIIAALTFVAIAFLRIPLLGVLLSLGLPASIWAWYRLGRA